MTAAIGRVTSILAIPYGYTVTLGSAALLAVARLGSPAGGEVLCFVAGAVLGFLLLAGVGRSHLAAEIPMRVPWVIVFNLVPVVAALALLVLPGTEFGRGPGYFAYSFLATTVYVGCVALLVRLCDRWTDVPRTPSGASPR